MYWPQSLLSYSKDVFNFFPSEVGKYRDFTPFRCRLEFISERKINSVCFHYITCAAVGEIVCVSLHKNVQGRKTSNPFIPEQGKHCLMSELFEIFWILKSKSQLTQVYSFLSLADPGCERGTEIFAHILLIMESNWKEPILTRVQGPP